LPRVDARSPRALTIAGSDSGGGAGIQADLKTFSALGVYGMTAITAVTVQNTKGVTGYEEVSPHLVAEQIRAVVTDIGVDAAKTGMLASAGIIEAVADAARETGLTTLVVDPVFVSKHGHPLLEESAVDALRARIVPLAAIVTPNLHEASGLAGFAVSSRGDMERAAAAILELGPRAVLLKGGHLEDGSASDLYADGTTTEWLEAERIDTPHTLRPVGGDRGVSRARGGADCGGPSGQGLRDRRHPPFARHRPGHRPRQSARGRRAVEALARRRE
jgi:hydroxymethylpyrimidine/phosphomethylpyrimidine kinase